MKELMINKADYEVEKLLNYMKSGKPVVPGTQEHITMCQLSQRALRITMELNSKYHSPDEIREFMSLLTGEKVDESFNMFPPFYTDFGANIHIGKNVWIGANATILPGVSIGDGAVVAAGAVVTKNVAENTVVGGVPAKVIRKIN